MNSLHSAARSAVLSIAMSVMTVGAMGCGAAASDDNTTADEAIVNGSADTTHRAAVTITWSKAVTGGTQIISCSGALIQSDAVLTAGHCVKDGAGYGPATINSPFAGKSSLEVSSVLAGYNGDGAATLDFAIIFLKTPIALAVYPTIVGNELNVGSSPKVEAVGRTHNGSVTGSLWTSAVLTVTQATATTYVAAGETIQKGDSGGPVFKAGTTQLIGVTWGYGSSTSLFTRSDLIKGKIAAILSEHH